MTSFVVEARKNTVSLEIGWAPGSTEQCPNISVGKIEAPEESIAQRTAPAVIVIVYGIIRIGRAPQIRKHLNFILNLKINSNDYNKVII
jgi:hypothetical protein